MVKHSSMLAICFMFYMIGNIIASPSPALDRYYYVTDCYRQMFAVKLIEGKSKSDGDQFYNVKRSFESVFSKTDILNVFEYIWKRLDKVGGPSSHYSLNNETDTGLVADFNKYFVITDDLDSKIIDLKNRRENGISYGRHCNSFIEHYSPDGSDEKFKSPATFCYEFWRNILPKTSKNIKVISGGIPIGQFTLNEAHGAECDLMSIQFVILRKSYIETARGYPVLLRTAETELKIIKMDDSKNGYMGFLT